MHCILFYSIILSASVVWGAPNGQQMCGGAMGWLVVMAKAAHRYQVCKATGGVCGAGTGNRCEQQML